MSETVTIEKSKLEELEQDSYLLDCLRHAGVDNWDGFEFALEEYREKYSDLD